MKKEVNVWKVGFFTLFGLIIISVGFSILNVMFFSCINFVGDVNGDREINRLDIQHINGYLEGKKLRCVENADINKDGSIDLLDSLSLNKILLSEENLINKNTPGNTEEKDDKSSLIKNFNNMIASIFKQPEVKLDEELDEEEQETSNQIDNSPDAQGSPASSGPQGYGGQQGYGGSYSSGTSGSTSNQAPLLTVTCENNPPGIQAYLECTVNSRCDGYAECTSDFCWGSSSSSYTCQNECATLNKYTPSPKNCCKGLEYKDGLCNSLILVKVSCENNPPECDGAELSCPIGSVCDCNSECSSNLCSKGKCLASNSNEGETKEQSSPPPSPTASSTGSKTPVNYLIENKAPFYQRLTGWFIKIFK